MPTIKARRTIPRRFVPSERDPADRETVGLLYDQLEQRDVSHAGALEDFILDWDELRAWLYTPTSGTPQGGVASPLLMNCYLHEFDMEWWRRYGGMSRLEKERRRRHGLGNVSLLRYADDFLALTSGRKEEALELKEELGAILSNLGLTLSAEKTLVTHVDDGLDFLGFHIQRRSQRSEPGRKALYVTPTERNIQRYKDKIHELLAEPNADVVNKLRALNQVISGWANYYRHVQSYRDRSNLDYWTFG